MGMLGYMPIFDVKCDRCGIQKDVLAHYSERVLCECGEEMRRLVSQPGYRRDHTVQEE